MPVTAPRLKTAVLISGRGSNMEALVRAAEAPDYPAQIALVLSNRADAPGLEFARQAGLGAVCVPHKGHGDRESFERAMDAVLAAEGIEFLCLAGFMRLLSPWFVERWLGRMISIHPALLPSFKGLDTHARALAAGVRIHGCTVHFVSPDLDAGPIIAQAAVPVLSDDTPERLASRVLAQEHIVYPRALALVASGRVRYEVERDLGTVPAEPSSVLQVPGPV